MQESGCQPTMSKSDAPARKPYEPPEVVYETWLEIRAGSPLMPPFFDPLNMGGPGFFTP